MSFLRKQESILLMTIENSCKFVAKHKKYSLGVFSEGEDILFLFYNEDVLLFALLLQNFLPAVLNFFDLLIIRESLCCPCPVWARRLFADRPSHRPYRPGISPGRFF